MGTDIHVVFQKKVGDAWVDIPHNYNEDRHYQLFAVLAGVRNGVGFAGVRTGDPVRPISKPRGYPEDFAVVDDNHPAPLEAMSAWRRKSREEHPEWYKDDDGNEDNGIYMGYHDQSWLTGEEMLAWTKKSPIVTHYGILNRDVYEKWDGKSEPESYCGGISGKDVIQVNDIKKEMKAQPKWTHVACHWSQSLGDELAYFFDEVRRLVKLHGEIRMVFGFDS